MAPEPLDHIFPGSWINANFDVWIGAEEDNQAWTQLLRARQTFDAATGVPEDRRAPGVRGTADRRGQRLVLVVRAGARIRQPRRSSTSSTAATWPTSTASSNLAPPEELSRPILRVAVPAVAGRALRARSRR